MKPIKKAGRKHHTRQTQAQKDFEDIVRELPYWTKQYGPAQDVIGRVRLTLERAAEVGLGE